MWGCGCGAQQQSSNTQGRGVDTYRFELGDSVDLDWEGRRLVLPYDIDAFKVLTYIRMYLRELFRRGRP